MSFPCKHTESARFPRFRNTHRQASRRGTSPLAVTWSWVPEATGEPENPTGCFRKVFQLPDG